MDPISAVFASVLDVVSNQISDHLLDVTGARQQSVIVEHQGVRIPFSYQRWTIQPQSVCRNQGRNVEEFSRCTVAAKSMFSEACERLQKERGTGWRHAKLQNMYCSAAVSYQPTVANIGWSAESSPLDEARTACNLATAELIGNPDPAAKRRKQEVCDRYNALKAGK